VPKRPVIFLVAAVVVAIASVGGALAFGSQNRSTSQSPTAIPTLGAALQTLMDKAQAAGPYSVTCEPNANGKLSCAPMRDEDVIPALRSGEEVYGRTVIAFPGGADPAEDSGPMFDASDLVCSTGGGQLLDCSSVSTMAPTVQAGTQVLVVYRMHKVTFDSNGRLVSHLNAPTVSVRVTSGSG
jgi:hypothetical protein